MRTRSFASVLVAGGLLLACGGPPTPKSGGRDRGGDGNPLGPSYVLMSMPTEDQTLLGRILPSVPAPGRSLEETSRANPCAAKLSEAATTPLANSYEDAQEVSASASAKAMLGAFGFQGDVNRATHFVYKLETQKRVGMRDTAEYDQCCKEKGCGYGYISALIYGEGEYATGEETSGSAGVSVAAVGSASGSANVKILHKRKVKGWMAAVVTVTDPSKKSAEQLGPLGVAAAAGITEATVPETVKVLYDKDKISVEGAGDGYRFKDGRGAEITENEFVRRYRDTTATNELDEYERRRNPISFYASGSLLALSLGAAVYGFTHLQAGCTAALALDRAHEEDCAVVRGKSTFSQGTFAGYDPNKTTQSEVGTAIAIGGTLGTIGFGIWFLVAAFRYDATATDHFMNDRDAILYSTKYNRSLLRRTVKQVQKTQERSGSLRLPGLTLQPQIGLGAMGLTGTF